MKTSNNKIFLGLILILNIVGAIANWNSCLPLAILNGLAAGGIAYILGLQFKKL